MTNKSRSSWLGDMVQKRPSAALSRWKFAAFGGKISPPFSFVPCQRPSSPPRNPCPLPETRVPSQNPCPLHGNTPVQVTRAEVTHFYCFRGDPSKLRERKLGLKSQCHIGLQGKCLYTSINNGPWVGKPTRGGFSYFDKGVFFKV